MKGFSPKLPNGKPDPFPRKSPRSKPSSGGLMVSPAGGRPNQRLLRGFPTVFSSSIIGRQKIRTYFLVFYRMHVKYVRIFMGSACAGKNTNVFFDDIM
jgi:hypothetical protein